MSMLREILSEQPDNTEKPVNVVEHISSFLIPISNLSDRIHADAPLRHFCYNHELRNEINDAMKKMLSAKEALLLLLKEAEKEVAIMKKEKRISK